MPEVVVRPLSPADIPAAQRMSHAALREAGQRYGWDLPALDDALAERGRRRFRHLLTHDPDGCFVAELDAEPLGVALASRRGPLWFLSLLTVATGAQASGVGRRLLDAALRSCEQAGAICATDDPKALRRYRRAGFDLHPGYEASGGVDRALLPAVGGVRPGSYHADADLVEAVATAQRGAGHGPDLDFFAAAGAPLFVLDEPDHRGYVVCGAAGPTLLAATSPDGAARLLWTALAETTEAPVRVNWLTHRQQWAVDVALDARLTLRPTGTLCLAGPVGPLAPYLPSGAFG